MTVGKGCTDLFGGCVQSGAFRQRTVLRRVPETKSVATEAWENVQVNVINLLSGGYAVSKEQIDALATDTADAKGLGQSLCNAEQM